MEHTEEQFDDLDIDLSVDEIDESTEAETDAASEPDDSASPVTSDQLRDLEVQVETLKSRNDQLMRVAADFENYKRRQEREKEEMAKYAGQQVVANLLTVLDNFERALQAQTHAQDPASFIEGVRMIQKQLAEVLSKANVSIVDAVGQPFNPEFHEAIASEVNDEVEDETVLEEFQKGYIMHGRLIRPAIVKVSKVS